MLGYAIAEKAMAPHSSTLAWRIPWTEEPGRLQSSCDVSVVMYLEVKVKSDAVEMLVMISSGLSLQ